MREPTNHRGHAIGLSCPKLYRVANARTKRNQHRQIQQQSRLQCGDAGHFKCLRQGLASGTETLALPAGCLHGHEFDDHWFYWNDIITEDCRQHVHMLMAHQECVTQGTKT